MKELGHATGELRVGPGEKQIIAGPRKYNFEPGVPQKFPRAEFETLLGSYPFLETCPAPAPGKGPKEK